MLEKFKSVGQSVAKQAGERAVRAISNVKDKGSKQAGADYVVALDIGTEYVKALIGHILPGGNIDIVGVGRQHQALADMQAGAIADIAILGIRTGKFGYFDYTGYKVEGTQKLECEMTIRNGKIVFDMNGIANPVIAPNASLYHPLR